jgi:hypothetical protein
MSSLKESGALLLVFSISGMQPYAGGMKLVVSAWSIQK